MTLKMPFLDLIVDKIDGSSLIPFNFRKLETNEYGMSLIPFNFRK